MKKQTKLKRTLESMMELDPDLQLLSGHYQMQIKHFKVSAFILAFVTLGMVVFFSRNLLKAGANLGDTGSYIGGISAPFMAIVGFQMLYVTLLNQQNQLVYQYQAIRNQNKQFQQQSFDSTFFHLMQFLESTKKEIFHNATTSLKGIVGGFRAKIENFAKQGPNSLPNYKGIINHNPGTNWTAIPPKELSIEYVKQLYFTSFTKPKPDILKLINSVLIVLTHINISDTKKERNKYFNILFYRLSTEQRVSIAYFSIFETEVMDDSAIQLLKTFSQTFPKSVFIHGEPHYRWLFL